MTSQEQERKDKLEREATRSAAHFYAVALRERNSQGRLPRLLAIAERANQRAERRLKATYEIL